LGPSFALLGGVQDGAWISPELAAAQMPQRAAFDFYDQTDLVGKAGGSVSYLGVPPSCAGYQVTTDLASNADYLTGVVTGWPVLTRPGHEFPTDTPVYTQAVADWLAGQGIDQPVIEISRILRVDVEGDGVDEVFIAASHFKEQSGHLAEYGDYSLVLMRKVLAGSVITVPFVEDLYRSKDPELVFPHIYVLAGVMDLNQDSKLDVVIAIHFWEGFGAQVYEIKATKTMQVLKVECGP
jgi:hypothetical protein